MSMVAMGMWGWWQLNEEPSNHLCDPVQCLMMYLLFTANILYLSLDFFWINST